MSTSRGCAGEREAAYGRFDSYAFEADDRFQGGLAALERSSETCVLEMKLFYYNRFVEPIDSTEYKQWSCVSPGVTDCGVETLKRLTLSESDTSGNSAGETSQEHKLSFEQVMRLIQAGEDVPGVTKLDVKPINQSPTPSKMQRILKPWEIQ